MVERALYYVITMTYSRHTAACSYVALILCGSTRSKGCPCTRPRIPSPRVSGRQDKWEDEGCVEIDLPRVYLSPRALITQLPRGALGNNINIILYVYTHNV